MVPRSFTACLCAALLASSTAARAAGPVEEARAKAAARPLAEQGYDRFVAGDYEGAIRLFEQAELHYHAPSHLLYVARARAKLGQLVEARDGYRRIVAERLEASAPEAFFAAQRDARRELDELEARMPPAEPRPEPAARAVAAADEPFDPFVPAAVVSYGLGGAALVGAIVTGSLAQKRIDELDERCVDHACPPDAEPLADSAGELADASTALFVVAGAGVAAGTVLLIAKPSEDVAAAIGPSSVHVRVTF